MQIGCATKHILVRGKLHELQIGCAQSVFECEAHIQKGMIIWKS